MPVKRLPVIGVMGSGTEPYEKFVAPLGRWLAQNGFHLLTGGGGGVMASVSRAFTAVRQRQGLCIGIIPGGGSGIEKCKSGYPNPYVEIPIFTHLPLSGPAGKDVLSRNHINILTADIIIALPGGAGTHSEIELAIKYKKPIAAYLETGMNTCDLPAQVHMLYTLTDVQKFILQVHEHL